MGFNINEEIRGRPELGAVLGKFYAEGKVRGGGIIYDADVEHLSPALKAEITQIHSLTHALLYIASDLTMTDQVRQESHEVLERLVDAWGFKPMEIQQDSPLYGEKNQILSSKIKKIVSSTQGFLDSARSSTRKREVPGQPVDSQGTPTKRGREDPPF